MSIFATAMGPDFERLHPMMRKRFGVSVAGGRACIGRGVMDEVWHGPSWTLPFLRLGSWRNILVPVQGRDIPFMIENYPYVDSLGRETVSFNRTFEVPPRRARFDAQMVLDPGRNQVVDFLGTHQHLATPLSFEVTPEGGLTIRSHDQVFQEGPLRFRFPDQLTGQAVLHERYDESIERFRIEVSVSNRRFGRLAGYRGTFTCTWPAIGDEGVPASVKPRREDPRL